METRIDLCKIQEDLSWVEEQIELIKRKKVYLKRNKIIKRKKLEHLENIRDTLSATLTLHRLSLFKLKERIDKIGGSKDEIH